MLTTAATPNLISRAAAESVVAVPPLARNADFSLNEAENRKLIRHLEAGGVRVLLYGGNANLYHVELDEYEKILALIAREASKNTLVIPSAGPAFGTMMDQARILRRHSFATAMVLPQVGITTSPGVAAGIARFVQAAGMPALLYIKHDGYIDPPDVKRLADEKLISGIKYAIVRSDPSRDDTLRRLLDVVNPNSVISGIGEQPAIVHLRDFALGGFTSGCVCVAPRLSTKLLAATRSRNWPEADRVRAIFKPLEDLRNAINPIRVLHEAVRLASIAETGPLLPLLTNVPPSDHPPIREAARALLRADRGEAQSP
jgi:dihydrodipicolinate synthase/N-acetylneuraminate lyase